jgi:hypothetical protein
MIKENVSDFVLDLGDDLVFEKADSQSSPTVERTEEKDPPVPGEKIVEVQKPSDFSGRQIPPEEEQEEEEDGFSIVPLAKEWFKTEGWEWKDEYLPEDSLKGFTDLLRNVVKQNSKPSYFSEEARRFDEYLANGGDPYRYLSEVFSEKRGSAVRLNPENPKHHKKILEAFLSETTQFDAEEIDQYLEMLEATGKIEAEAKKAHGKLQSLAEAKAKELEQKQKQEKERQDREIDAYIENIKSTIEKLDVVAGYELTKEDKKNFVDYVLKIEKDGKTRYEKDLSSNLETGLKVAFMMFKKMYDVKVDQRIKSKAAREIFESLGNLGRKKSSPQNRNLQDDFFNSLQDL